MELLRLALEKESTEGIKEEIAKARSVAREHKEYLMRSMVRNKSGYIISSIEQSDVIGKILEKNYIQTKLESDRESKLLKLIIDYQIAKDNSIHTILR